METLLKVIGAAVLAVILIAAVCFFTAFLTQWLFNSLANEWQFYALLPQLTYWQAFKLNWLCGILFKSSSSSK